MKEARAAGGLSRELPDLTVHRSGGERLMSSVPHQAPLVTALCGAFFVDT